jgi:hypothetical protein
LRDDYFANYRRLVYLIQTEDAGLITRAEAIAARLDLPLEVRHTGFGALEQRLKEWMDRHADEAAATSP